MGLFDDLIPGGKPSGGGGLFDDLIPAKPASRPLWAVANDTVIEGANAIAGGVKAVADFVKPGNTVSSFIDENIIRPGEAKQSDLIKAEKARLAQDVENSDGVLDEIGSTLGYVGRNPLLTAAQAAGSFVMPGAAIKGAGALGRAAGMGASTAGLAGGVVAGAALSGGDAAGQAYELAIRAGASEAQAIEAARQASQIPAAVGGLTGAFGAERVFAGAGGFTGGALSRGLKTGASEAAQEALEEGVTQYEAQRAAQPFDSTIDPTKGVASAATLGAALGGITGGAIGALSPQESRQDQAMRALSSARNVDEALAAFDVATDVPVLDQAPVLQPQGDPFAQREADRPAEPTGEVQPGDILSPSGTPFLTMPAALHALQEAGEGFELQRVAEGLVVRPVVPVTGDDALPVLPGGRTFERTMGNIALDADRARAEQRKAAELDALPAAAAEQQAQQEALQRAATLEGPSALAAALRSLRPPAEPAAAPSAAAPAPTEPRIVPRTADMQPMSLARAQEAAAAIPGAEVVAIRNLSGKLAYTVLPPSELQSGDLLTVDGFPYGSRSAATLRARKDGGEVVQVPGGYVVRQQQETPRDAARNDVEGDGGAGVAVTGRGDGTLGAPEPGPVDVPAGPGVAAPEGRSSVPAAGVAPEPGRPAGALSVGATFERDGKTWTVTESNDRRISARDADGNQKLIAVGSKAWQAITQSKEGTAAQEAVAAQSTQPAPAVPSPEQINAAAPAKVAEGLSESRGEPSAPVAAAPYDGPTMAEINALNDVPTVDVMREAIEAVGEKEFERAAQARIELDGGVKGFPDSMLIEATARQIVALKRREQSASRGEAAAEPAAEEAAAAPAAPQESESAANNGSAHGDVIESGASRGEVRPATEPLRERIQKRKTTLAAEVARKAPYQARIDALQLLRACING